MKYYLRIMLSFLLLFMGCVPAGAQTFPSNTIKLGDGANTDKKIVANKGAGAANPLLKYNATGNAWQFSTDGVNFSDFGSGSGAGGGLNLITKNPDFEQGATNGWSNTGGTYAAVNSGSNLLFGKGSVVFTASASGQFVQSDLYTVPEGLGGKNCLARAYYKGGATSYLLKVLDSASTVIASESFPAVATKTEVNPVNFPCPAAGTQIRLRVESTAAAAIIALDRMHLGEADNLFQLSQSSFIGSLKYAPTANCRWQLTVSSFTDYPVDNDCLSPTVTGDLLANDGGKVPGFKLPSVKPGTYLIIALGSFRHFSAAGNWPLMRFTDGLQFTNEQGIETGTSGTNSGTVPMVSGMLTYTAPQSNVNVRMQGGANGGTQSSEIYNEGNATEFQVYYYPSQSQTALKPEAVNWSIDANIGGSANVSLSTSSQTSWTPTENSSLDMVINSGSIGAQIPCSGSQPATGLTCSGGADESVGVSFDLPAAQKVEVCFDYSQGAVSSSGGNTIFQLIQTGNTDQTPVLFGNTRTHTQLGADSIFFPYKTCGLFDFTSAGQKTIRLMYQQLVGGYSANTIVTDRAGGGLGNRDIHVSVRPVNQSYPAPVLIDSVSSDAGVPIKHVGVRISLGASPAIVNQTGNTFTGVSGSGATKVINMQGWSVAPICTYTAVLSATDFYPVSQSLPTTSQIQVVPTLRVDGTGSAATSADYVDILCTGVR